MSFVGKVWKILVGIKDGLVLLFMLLFFVALFGILSARPNPGQVRDGALVIDLSGIVVEEKSVLNPIEAILSRSAPMGETRARQQRYHGGDARKPCCVVRVGGQDAELGGGNRSDSALGAIRQRQRKASARSNDR
jgi:protease-4